MSELLAISKLHEKRFQESLEIVASLDAKASIADVSARVADEERRVPYPLTVTDSGVSVIHVSGALMNRESYYNRFYGLISYQSITDSIMYMLEETDTKVAVFKYDTLGGSVNGMSDVAELISSLPMDTISFASGSMASAGYFLGSQSDEVYADKMSMVGSIGVIVGWYNYSKMLAKNGIKPERFRSGDLKAVGGGDFELTKKERDHVTSMVTYMANVFFDIVSEARGIPVDVMKTLGITSGREFIGEEAKQVMLIDDVMSYDKVLLKAYGMAEKALTISGSNVYTGR